MKFQKTLLALALSLSVVTVANAADPVKDQTVVYQYGKTDALDSSDVIYKIDGVAYTLGENGFEKFEGDASEYKHFLRGGLVDSDTKIGEDTTETVVKNADESHSWNFSKDVTVTNPGGSTILGGTITAPQEGTAQDVSGIIDVAPSTTVTQSINKNLSVGQFAEDKLGVLATDFITNGDQAFISGTGLTSQGLGLVANTELNENTSVDFANGTVTVTNVTGGVSTGNQQVKAYGTDQNIEVLEVAGKYYSVKGSELTEFKGDTSKLNLIGAGAATGLNDSKTVTETTQALVSAKNVVYGESKESFDNANILTVGNADADSVLEAGKQYNFGGEAANKTSSSKGVVTGIIATDDKGNNTYGLQATNTVNGKVTAQTTVTAEGLNTTGDVVINGVSVNDSLSKTNSDISKLQGNFSNLSSNVSRLNDRVNDVEKTSHRGIAIALATQQQIPNIGAGQYAVFGGAGHYKGESAGAIGVASVFADGRTSLSAAVGFSGGNEVGGRVGVSYVFGGK